LSAISIAQALALRRNLIDHNSHSPNELAAFYAVIRNYFCNNHAKLVLTLNLARPKK